MSQNNNPWQQELSQGQGASAGYYQDTPQSQTQQPTAPGGQNQNQTFQPPRRSQTDQVLPQGEERSEQLETMQGYEARAPQSEDDKAQAALQKEFPGIDSSLIAALYSDTKNVAETRELLQELARGG